MVVLATWIWLRDSLPKVSAPASDLALWMIGVISRDTALPLTLRRSAERLSGLALKQPDIAIARLDSLSRDYTDKAEYQAPAQQLAKCVSVESFWSHYIDDRVKVYFPTAEDYRRLVDTDPGRLLGDLRRSDPLISKEHSWLAPYAALAGADGTALVGLLELRARPPLVLLLLGDPPHPNVRVRTPRATDAVIGKLAQWRLGGPASGVAEFIDHDIPRAAIATAEWRT